MSTGILIRGTVIDAHRNTETGRLEMDVAGTGQARYHVIAPYDAMPGKIPSSGEKIEITGTASYGNEKVTVWADSVRRTVPNPGKNRRTSAFLR